MHINAPRQYTPDQVKEFVAEAIESYVEAARTDADMPLDALEYTLDIARYALAQVSQFLQGCTSLRLVTIGLGVDNDCVVVLSGAALH